MKDTTEITLVSVVLASCHLTEVLPLRGMGLYKRQWPSPWHGVLQCVVMTLVAGSFRASSNLMSVVSGVIPDNNGRFQRHT